MDKKIKWIIKIENERCNQCTSVHEKVLCKNVKNLHLDIRKLDFAVSLRQYQSHTFLRHAARFFERSTLLARYQETAHLLKAILTIPAGP